MSSVNLNTLLYEEIETEFDKLNELTPGSEEHKAVLDGLAKLMDRAIEMEKIEVDSANKDAARESEQLMKQQEMAIDKKDRLGKTILGVVSIVLPTLVTIWGTKVSMKFETTDTVTTTAGKNYFKQLFRIK